MKTENNFLLNLFPPPDYLLMPAICLDISDRSIKYVEFHKKHGRLAVKKYGLYHMPEGIVQKGEIRQKDKLVNLLKSIQKEQKNRLIVASLPEEKVFLSRVKFPLMPKNKIREAIELQLEEYVPLRAEEAIFDFDIIKETENENHTDINIIAFPKNFVEDYKVVLREAGYAPMVFEMEAYAFARAVVPSQDKSNVMVVDFGRTRATFAIVGNGKVQFATTVSIAGQDIENAIISKLKIPQDQVEKVKREVGLSKTKGGGDVFDAVLPMISVIRDEIRKQVDYWASHYGEHSEDENKEKGKISRVILCGGESTLAGLPEYLSFELRLKVELGNPWVNVCSFEEYIPEIEKGDALAYSTVIGLALRQWQ